jgi:imidazolonepropionase-like amidohydrolase
VDAPVVALVHVRVIDGTGAPPAEDQTIVIDPGKIAAAGPVSSTSTPAGAQVLDLAGHTVIPGLVGMHEHLFYLAGGGIPMYNEQAFSFPRLYLASGVTTARTAGGASGQQARHQSDAPEAPPNLADVAPATLLVQ